MTQHEASHVEPSRHSTEEVDDKLRKTEGHVAEREGAESPAIKPNKDLGEDGKPLDDSPRAE